MKFNEHPDNPELEEDDLGMNEEDTESTATEEAEDTDDADTAINEAIEEYEAVTKEYEHALNKASFRRLVRGALLTIILAIAIIIIAVIWQKYMGNKPPEAMPLPGSNSSISGSSESQPASGSGLTPEVKPSVPGIPSSLPADVPLEPASEGTQLADGGYRVETDQRITIPKRYDIQTIKGCQWYRGEVTRVDAAGLVLKQLASGVDFGSYEFEVTTRLAEKTLPGTEEVLKNAKLGDILDVFQNEIGVAGAYSFGPKEDCVTYLTVETVTPAQNGGLTITGNSSSVELVVPQDVQMFCMTTRGRENQAAIKKAEDFMGKSLMTMIESRKYTGSCLRGTVKEIWY